MLHLNKNIEIQVIYNYSFMKFCFSLVLPFTELHTVWELPQLRSVVKHKIVGEEDQVDAANSMNDK